MLRLPASFTRTDTIALIVASAFFMEVLDATVIAPAIPHIASDFGTSPASLSAGISAYLITVAIFIPTSGWLADRFGVRTVFVTALSVFILASVWCGLSSSLPEFVVARILQGIGGAMMSPVGRMEVMRRTPKERFMRAMAMVSWPGLSGFIVGPPLGGFFATYMTWHWIFFINVPIGIVGLTLVLRYFTNERAEPRPFDWAGFLLFGGGLGSLMAGLEIVGHGIADWRLGTGLIALGATLGLAAIRHAVTARHPLLSLAPLKMQTFAVGAFSAGSLFRLTIGASGFLFPTMFQIAFGMNAFDAGLLMLAFAVGDLAMKLRATYFVRRFGLRPVLIVNGLLATAAMAAIILFTAQTPFWVMAVVLVVAGMFRSQQFTALGAMSFADIPPNGISNATALSNMLQQVSFGLGVALSAMLLVASSLATGGDGAVLALFDFRVVVGAFTVLTLLSVLFFLRLPPDAGAAVSGHRKAADAQ